MRRDVVANRLPHVLITVTIAVMAITAAKTTWLEAWALENLAVVALLAVLAATYRRLPLSNLSYLLLAVFLCLHEWGAQHQYTDVPAGLWLRRLLDTPRDHYDRAVHFAFGLLCAIPIREVITRAAAIRGGWSFYLPIQVCVALSGAYEMLESLVAAIVDPEAGTVFLGAQGDAWDAQKDMGLALLGAIVAMVAVRMAGGKATGSGRAHSPAMAFGENRFLHVLIVSFLAVWIASAVNPTMLFDWVLENLLVFAIVTALIATYRRHSLSNTSYLLIAAFLSMHEWGANHKYADVPLGEWLKPVFDTRRNHYDRVMHLFFGLFLAYPLFEIFHRAAGASVRWSAYLALDCVLASSVGYELMEAAVAHMVNPTDAEAFVGMQGDIWDAQKDMALAVAGALIALALTMKAGRRPAL